MIFGKNIQKFWPLLKCIQILIQFYFYIDYLFKNCELFLNFFFNYQKKIKKLCKNSFKNHYYILSFCILSNYVYISFRI